MSKPTWTEAQKNAIDLRGRTLLVSAAAGSGKTAVLTERIIGRLDDVDSPLDLSRLLAVTFTKAAASELKTRLSRAISERLAASPRDRRLTSQLLLLDSAKICTIHSFCLDLVKKHLRELGLPTGMSVGDDTEIKLMRRDLLDELVDAYYAGNFNEGFELEGFAEFMDNFSLSKNDSDTLELFLKLYDKLMCMPDGLKFLADSATALEADADKPFFETRHGRLLAAQCADFLEFIAVSYDSFLKECDDDTVRERYLPVICEERDFAQNVCALLRELKSDAAAKLVNAFEFARLPSLPRGYCSELAERFKLMRTDFKKGCQSYLYPIFETIVLPESEHRSAELIRKLYVLLCAFDSEFAAAKRKLCKLDFTDIERFTHRLLVENGEPSRLARELAEDFDEIYIDEYQDTNSVQDEIFSSLAKNNRFMVGDIKQSIYGFRGAAPENFARYRDSFPPYKNGDSEPASTVFLQNNFRCDRSVTELCNRIFGCIFRNNSGRVKYFESDDLVCSKSGGEENCVKPKIVLAAADNEKLMNEADYTADEIRRLIDFGKKKNGEPIRPSDIAVLVRSNAAALPLEKALRERSVPTAGSFENGFFEKPEIILMMALLNVIDNPTRDIYLAGVLRSPIYNFTLDELAVIRAASDAPSLYEALIEYTDNNDFGKGRRFLSELAAFRFSASGMPTDRLLHEIFRKTHIFSIIAASDSDDVAKDNLRLLYKYARDFESGSYKGLFGFIRYIDDIIKRGAKLVFENSETKDAVNIMTVHHSKGLEFPVVFLYHANKLPNTAGDKSAAVLIDPDAGVSIDLCDRQRLSRLVTYHRRALERAMDEKYFDEEMRVLYVALTRARERLYITAEYTDPEREYDKTVKLSRSLCRFTVMRRNSFMTLALAALMSDPDFTDYDLIFPEKGASETDLSPARTDCEKCDAAPPDIDLLISQVNYVYPHAAACGLPSKLTVSKLYPEILDEASDTDYTSDMSEALEQLIGRITAIKPKFASDAEKANAAARGTATHLFMQFCDYSRAERDIEAELARLLSERFIDPKNAELADTSKLSRFFESKLYLENIKKSPHVFREYRFNMALPASEFTASSELAAALADESLFVQGVIDCFFENPDGTFTVIDYKTDKIPRELYGNETAFRSLLCERHSRQLGYYARAVEQITRKPVTRVALYSFDLSDTVELDLPEKT